MSQSWDENLMSIARVVALRSKDPSTKIGAVIVGDGMEIRSTGYNGFARGVRETPERWERPEKYSWVKHAEENAIINAARVGTPLRGTILYCSGAVCDICASAIVNAGIIEVVAPRPEKDAFTGRADWVVHLLRAEKILREGGVRYRLVDF